MITRNIKRSQYQSGKILLRHMLLLVILVVGLVILFKKGYFPSIDRIPILSSMVNYLQAVSLPEIPKPEFNFDGQPSNENSSVSANYDLLTPDMEEPESNSSDITILSDNGWQPPNYDDSPATNPDALDKSTSIYIPPPAPTQPKPLPTPTRINTDLPKPKNDITPYPDALQEGYYTVQVHAGYNSKDAYNITRQLKKDGYQAFIVEKEDGQGRLFRVRIGQYQNLNSARAVRDQIRRRYPKTLNDSFVLLRQRQ